MTARTRLTAVMAGLGVTALLGLAFAGPAGALAAPTPYPTGSGTSTPTSTPTGPTGPVTADPGTPSDGAAITAGAAVTLGGGGATPNSGVGAGIASSGSASGFVARPYAATSVGLGSTTSDGSGHYSVTVTIPSDIPNGPATLFTTDSATGKTLLSISVNITGSTLGTAHGSGSGSNSGGSASGAGGSGGSGSGLAATGIAVVGVGVLGVALLIGGAVLLLAGRRRKLGNTA